MGKKNCEAAGASLILRLAIASLFFAAAFGKFSGGLDGVVGYFQSVFAETWLPMWLVTLHARVIPFIELLIPIWLILGFKLRLAWFVTGLTTVSLAFGMMVARQYDVAADNYLYVLMSVAGLYFSQFDCLSIDGRKCCKKERCSTE
jgi:uncharacterized membrane protein YphA (DoxX/SURF4 family)